MAMPAPPPERARVAVLMPSCDRYASLWPLSLAALDRFWPGRPAPTWLVSNHRTIDWPGVRVLAVGDDVSWSDNLLRALREVPQDYVFLALDDLVMLPGTRADRLDALLALAVREDWDYLRVNPLPPPQRVERDGLGRCRPGEAYRAAVVWSLWKKSVLQAVLRPGESAWQFEKAGSARTDGHDRWWAAAERHVPYVNVVTAARADPAALRQLVAAGLDASGIDFPLMSAAEQRRHRWRLLRSKGLRWVPAGLRRAVLDTFAKP